MVQNVGTALAVLDAVAEGRVQTEAILTVSGRGVARPGILALTTAELGPQLEAGHCLRCARCVEACPIHLLPSRLARLGELGRAEEAREQGIELCMECGTCAFACPAGLPLVQWLRLGKQQVRHLSRSAS